MRRRICQTAGFGTPTLEPRLARMIGRGGSIVLDSLLFQCILATNARADDPVVFGIDWRAEAEYGGYYQAVANGIYAKHGLSVTIREGGPQVNHMQLLMAGRLDFN